MRTSTLTVLSTLAELDRWLRIPELVAETGLSRGTVYRALRDLAQPQGPIGSPLVIAANGRYRSSGEAADYLAEATRESTLLANPTGEAEGKAYQARAQLRGKSRQRKLAAQCGLVLRASAATIAELETHGGLICPCCGMPFTEADPYADRQSRLTLEAAPF